MLQRNHFKTHLFDTMHYLCDLKIASMEFYALTDKGSEMHMKIANKILIKLFENRHLFDGKHSK